MSTERDNLPVILSNLAHYDAMIKGYIKNRQGECAPLKHTHVKSEVGLSNVDNTADKNKVVASAAKWTNPMTLTVTGAMTGSVSFNGSAAASITLNEGDVSFIRSSTTITATTNWNLVTTPGCYSVSMTVWGTASTTNAPNNYDAGIFCNGLLVVFKSGTERVQLVQTYYPATSTSGMSSNILTRMLVGTLWTAWHPISAQIASVKYAGLVKSGGDITVSSDGTVTVNDDSHAHTIANVDGLQAILDSLEVGGSADNAYAKAVSYTDTKLAELVDSAPDTLNTLKELATAITSNQEVIDVLNSAISKKLPIAGGSMDTDATITFPNGINGRSVRLNSDGLRYNATSTDGWAMGVDFYNNSGTVRLGVIGALGGPDHLEYYYIGTNYDTAKFKVFNDGTTSAVNSKADKFTVKDAATIDYNESTDSLTFNFI